MLFRSFLELDWEQAPKVKAFVAEEFVLGPFLSALNDPVHNQEPGTFSVDSSESRTYFKHLFDKHRISVLDIGERKARLKGCYNCHRNHLENLTLAFIEVFH